MKKKILLLLLCACSLTGCSSKSDSTEVIQQEVENPEEFLDLEDLTEEVESTQEEMTEEQSSSVVESIPQNETASSNIDFSFSFIGEAPSTVTQSEETLVSMYVEDTLITMPLTYSDLERQGFSIDYQNVVVVDTPETRAYGLTSDTNWINVDNVAGDNLVHVLDERISSGSKVITSDTKIAIMSPSGVFTKVSYFGLEKDKSTYDEVDARMHELGFDEVKYISIDMDEFIVGCVNLNGNNCEVWMDISVFEEEGKLKDIYIINKSVLERQLSSEYSFKSNKYGEVASSSSSTTMIDSSIMDYNLNGKTYTYDSTLVDYIKNGWKLMEINPSESGGEVILVLNKGNASIQFVTTSMYVKTIGKHHDISEDTVPSYIVFDKSCMNMIDFMGVGGVCSYGQLEESDAFDFVDSSSGSSSNSVVCKMQDYGTVSFEILDNYVNGMKIQYER